ncbi:MAG: ABC transporter permease [Gaiellaceae bacterium]
MARIADNWYMLGRQFRLLARQPIWIAIMLVQPMIWMLLYSQLFRRLPNLGGFGTSSYVEYLTPGIVIMTAFSSGAWNGMTTVNELERGVFERFAAAPIGPSPLITSHTILNGITGAIQGVIILVIGLALGGHVHSGVAGWAVILFTGALAGMVFSSLSHGLGLLLRREESVIAAANFIVLPLMFVSSTLMAPQQMPHWMRVLASCNPVNWAVVAAREAELAGTDWALIGRNLGLLAAVNAAAAAFAVFALQRWRRSL